MKRNGEAKRINEIEKDIGSSFLRNFNFNDMGSNKAKLCSDREAESGAERFINILNAPECREFFLKVMYHLPYETRENLLAAARKPWIKAPKKYFTYCAKRELAKIGF